MPTRELKNGTLIDTETGKFVKGGTPTTAITTSERGREVVAKRYQMTRDRIREQVMQEVNSISDIPVNTPEDAYAFVVGKQTIALIDSEKPRFEDVEKLGLLMDLVEAKYKESQTPPQVVTHTIEPAVMELLSQIAAAQAENAAALPFVSRDEAIDAEAKDA